MSRGYVGADPDQLDALGQSLLAGAGRFDELRHIISTAYVSRGWHGHDADSTIGAWQTVHAPMLAHAVEGVRQLAHAALANAQAQRDASAADAGTFAPFGPWLPAQGGPDPDAEELRDYWLNLAAQRAGINLADWDPSLGATANRSIVESVYVYYGDLFLQYPFLHWMAMANIAGASLAAGFFDMGWLRDLAGKVSLVDYFPSLSAEAMALVANLSEEEVAYFEKTFLQMQKEVFFDQAMMHEAYLSDGMDAIRQLASVGLIDEATVNAWQLIDDGLRENDADKIAEGNRYLLYREQHDILQPHYAEMRNHGDVGPVVTALISIAADAGIPGASPYRDFNPIEVATGLPGGLGHLPGLLGDALDVEFYIRTHLPAGNLSNFDDRMGYADYLAEEFEWSYASNPTAIADLVSSPFADRVESGGVDVEELVGEVRHVETGVRKK